MKTTFPYTSSDIVELHRQSALLSLDPLSSEEIALLCNPAPTPEQEQDRLGMVQDRADRCGVEIDPCDANRHNLRDAEARADARKDAPVLSAQLERLGFAVNHSGGGCYCWESTMSNGLTVVITSADSPDLPTDNDPVCVGLYISGGDAIAQSNHESGLVLAEYLSAQ